MYLNLKIEIGCFISYLCYNNLPQKDTQLRVLTTVDDNKGTKRVHLLILTAN